MTFASLLAPISPEAFLDCYWEMRPLYMAGEPSKIDYLDLDLHKVLELLDHAGAEAIAQCTLEYSDAAGQHRELPLPRSAEPVVRGFIDAGLTLCVADFDRLHGPTQELARSIASMLGLPCAMDVTCRVSRPGAGVGLHLDSVPVLVAQCAGTKRWRFSDAPAVVDPPPSGLVPSSHEALSRFARRMNGQRLTVPLESELSEVTMSPGDLLYLPAGTWHRAYAGELSVALTFTLFPRRLSAALGRAVGRYMSRHLGRGVPSTDSDAVLPGDLRSWAGHAAAVLQELASTVSAHELVPLILEELEPDEARQLAPESNRKGAPPVLAAQVEATTWMDATLFVVGDPSERAMFTVPEDAHTPTTYVYQGEEGIRISEDLAAVCDWLLARYHFTLGEARSVATGLAVDNSALAELLASLCEIGVLTQSGS